jgi:ABC-type transport system involved in cytochrome c biogenesis ATPase subunit
MAGKFEDILVQCIDDIKADRYSLEDCLERYPSLRKRLEPLLKLALEIQPPPDLELSPGFKIKARVQLMEQIHAGRSVTKRAEPRYRNKISLIPRRRRFSMIGIIIAVVLAVSAAGGGTAYAAQASLPGDALYPVKLGTEQVRMVLPGDDVAKAERALSFAAKRVEEMTTLTERGRTENLNLAQDKYNDVMNAVLARIEAARGKGLSTASISELVAGATAEQLSALDKVYDRVPAEAKEAITKARQVSLKGQENALLALAQDNPVRAVEINMATAEERLNRARAVAEGNDVEEVENALQQYEELNQFGEEISQIAQGLGKNVATVEELVAKAISRHLSILDEVKAKVPDQAKPAIERAQEASINGLGNALKALAQENPARAMEINLAAMEARLNRVRAGADEGDVEEAEDALKQFEDMARFGEEISQIAQGLGKDVATVEELVARATSIHLEVLAKVREQVPEPARAAIDRAMQESERGYERATEALERIGASSDIPPKPPIPEGVPAPKDIPPVPKPEVPVGSDSDNETEVEEEEEKQEEQGEQRTPGPPSGIGGRP